MQGRGNTKMKGKLTKLYPCMCCTATNDKKLSLYVKKNWKLLDDNNDSTKDHPNIVKYFERKGIQIWIQAQHPFNLDVIFNRVTGKWLGYVDDYCWNCDAMHCDCE